MHDVQNMKEGTETPPPAKPSEGLSKYGMNAMQGDTQTGTSAPESSPPVQETIKPATRPQDNAPPGKKTEVSNIPSLTETPNVEKLPDGQSALVYGNPEEKKQLNHLQGQNDFGFQGTCGLVSCEQVMNQEGLNVNENDVVKTAASKSLCSTGSTPEKNGGTTVQERTQILNDANIPTHTEKGGDLDTLNNYLKEGKSVIASVNAGELWNDPNYYDNGQNNHAVLVTGTAGKPENGNLLGFFINDSGTGESGQFVDKEKMSAAWEKTGGVMNVTDNPLSKQPTVNKE
jgi:hypothetical protein